MAMKFIHRKFGNRAEFVIGDHYINIKWPHAKATSVAPGFATLVGDRYIVKAGTLITATSGGKSFEVGLAYEDIDVTDGDALIPVTVHAVVDRSALPAQLTYAQESALPQIRFIGGSETFPAPSDRPRYFIVDIDSAHATVAPQGDSSRIVPGGGSFAFKLTAESGYTVSSVTANGTALTADSKGVYTVADIDADTKIVVTASN